MNNGTFAIIIWLLYVTLECYHLRSTSFTSRNAIFSNRRRIRSAEESNSGADNKDEGEVIVSPETKGQAETDNSKEKNSDLAEGKRSPNTEGTMEKKEAHARLMDSKSVQIGIIGLTVSFVIFVAAFLLWRIEKYRYNKVVAEKRKKSPVELMKPLASTETTTKTNPLEFTQATWKTVSNTATLQNPGNHISGSETEVKPIKNRSTLPSPPPKKSKKKRQKTPTNRLTTIEITPEVNTEAKATMEQETVQS